MQSVEDPREEEPVGVPVLYRTEGGAYVITKEYPREGNANVHPVFGKLLDPIFKR